VLLRLSLLLNALLYACYAVGDVGDSGVVVGGCVGCDGGVVVTADEYSNGVGAILLL